MLTALALNLPKNEDIMVGAGAAQVEAARSVAAVTTADGSHLSRSGCG